MKYELTNGKRTETSDVEVPTGNGGVPYDDLIDEARAWAACADSDVSVMVSGDPEPIFTVSHETGRVR